ALSIAGDKGAASEVRVWDIASKKTLFEQVIGNNVVCVDLTPDWRTAVTGETDGHVYAWDVVTGKELGRVGKHDKEVTNVAISACGNFAVSRSSDTTIRAWRLPKRR
ncbi:MAG: WD40 repeat domain-containing protein, partial [Planctomycetales bacterium]|nr:WD40 repeat domain-containing protein [Planctomycetales bacterium]